MWRNSGSKLLLACNRRSYVYVSEEGVCLPSQLLSPCLSSTTSVAAATTTNTIAATASLDSFKLGLADQNARGNGNGTRASSSTASVSAVDVSLLASVGNFARHYGRCYWELSKARLSMLVVATSGTGYVLGSASAIDLAGFCWTCAGTMMVAASANSLNQTPVASCLC